MSAFQAPEILNPSSELSAVSAATRIIAVDPLAGRVELKVSSDQMGPLGDAIHSFLASDPYEAEKGRRAMAIRMLEAYGVASASDPTTLVPASDALRSYLSKKFPGATWRREWPVRARLTEQGHSWLLRGEVDLFLELPSGFALVDHESFPGGAKERDAWALAYSLQLALYARALEVALGKPLLAAFIHFAIRGEMVEVDLGPLLVELRQNLHP